MANMMMQSETFSALIPHINTPLVASLPSWYVVYYLEMCH
jgi:hypothetical protein